MEMEEGESCRSAKDVLGPISNFASDGDATRRRAQRLLTRTKRCGDFPELKMLQTCHLFDQDVGEGGVSDGYDLKHLVKRIRERAKSSKGLKVGDGAPINAAVLRQLIGMHQPDLPLSSLLAPDDR